MCGFLHPSSVKHIKEFCSFDSSQYSGLICRICSRKQGQSLYCRNVRIIGSWASIMLLIILVQFPSASRWQSHIQTHFHRYPVISGPEVPLQSHTFTKMHFKFNKSGRTGWASTPAYVQWSPNSRTVWLWGHPANHAECQAGQDGVRIFGSRTGDQINQVRHVRSVFMVSVKIHYQQNEDDRRWWPSRQQACFMDHRNWVSNTLSLLCGTKNIDFPWCCVLSNWLLYWLLYYTCLLTLTELG